MKFSIFNSILSAVFILIIFSSNSLCEFSSGNISRQNLIEVKKQIRCNVGEGVNNKRFKRYALSAKRGWKKRHLTYYVVNDVPTIRKDAVRRNVAKALKMWGDYGRLTFQEVGDRNADLVISFERLDHGDGFPFAEDTAVAAHAFAPNEFGDYAGDVHFNADFEFVENPKEDESGTDFFNTALHELGHSLGLLHSNIQGTVMFPILQYFQYERLHQDDIQGITELYINKFVEETEAPTYSHPTHRTTEHTSPTYYTRSSPPTHRTTQYTYPYTRNTQPTFRSSQPPSRPTQYTSTRYPYTRSTSPTPKTTQYTPPRYPYTRNSQPTLRTTQYTTPRYPNTRTPYPTPNRYTPISTERTRTSSWTPYTRRITEAYSNPNWHTTTTRIASYPKTPMVRTNYDYPNQHQPKPESTDIDAMSVEDYLKKNRKNLERTQTFMLPFIDSPFYPENCGNVAVIRGELIFFDKQNATRLGNGGYDTDGYTGKLWETFLNFPRSIPTIDAAYERPDGKIVFFSGSQFWVHDGQNIIDNSPRPLADLGLPNYLQKVDYVQYWSQDDITYIYAQNQIWGYNENLKRMESGYPKRIEKWRDCKYHMEFIY